MAEYSDLSTNFISKLERGQKTNINLLKLYAICQALGISISELLQEENNVSFETLTPSTLRLIHELTAMDPIPSERISQHILLVLDDFKMVYK